MTARIRGALIAALLIGLWAPARAQQAGTPPTPTPSGGPVKSANAATAVAPAAIPVRVEIAIARYQGEKRITRVPFTLVANATDPSDRAEPPTKLRVGVEVPVVAYQLTQDTKAGATTGQQGPSSAIQYRPFGTNIDCSVTTLDGGRFKVTVSIDDSAPYNEQDKLSLASGANGARALTANPVFRSFRVSNTLILRDGQSTQFSAWNDRFSGEQVRLDVTLSVLR